jgi:predicted RecA/RadA family phage recombinase
MTTGMLKQAGMEHTGVYKALFAMQQAAAIPSMIVATEEAATKALAVFPGPAGVALSQATRVMGYTSVGIAAGQAIGGMAHSGITEVPKEGTWLLDKGERVYTNSSAKQLDQMYNAVMSGAQAVSGGGNIEQHFHISGTRDSELEQLLKAAAMEGARMGYQQVVGDMRSNGPIKQMSRR